MKIETKFNLGEKVRCSRHDGSPFYFVDGFQIEPCGCVLARCSTFIDGELKNIFFREEEIEKIDETEIGFCRKEK